MEKMTHSTDSTTHCQPSKAPSKKIQVYAKRELYQKRGKRGKKRKKKKKEEREEGRKRERERERGYRSTDTCRSIYNSSMLL